MAELAGQGVALLPSDWDTDAATSVAATSDGEPESVAALAAAQVRAQEERRSHCQHACQPMGAGGRHMPPRASVLLLCRPLLRARRQRKLGRPPAQCCKWMRSWGSWPFSAAGGSPTPGGRPRCALACAVMYPLHCCQAALAARQGTTALKVCPAPHLQDEGGELPAAPSGPLQPAASGATSAGAGPAPGGVSTSVVNVDGEVALIVVRAAGGTCRFSYGAPGMTGAPRPGQGPGGRQCWVKAGVAFLAALPCLPWLARCLSARRTLLHPSTHPALQCTPRWPL